MWNEIWDGRDTFSTLTCFQHSIQSLIKTHLTPMDMMPSVSFLWRISGGTFRTPRYVLLPLCTLSSVCLNATRQPIPKLSLVIFYNINSFGHTNPNRTFMRNLSNLNSLISFKHLCPSFFKISAKFSFSYLF